ncbi:MAG: single-stranded-DNA-specific exonuclease RecJ [Cyclobacteriaceae bacterium]|nr:single-stranded-DNA-specific exonuclease RecJ [Cyclobacteriaceae bacterium]
MQNEVTWDIKSLPEEGEIRRLSEAINTNPVASALLLQRGIFDYDTAKTFFRPSLDDLHDPFIMKNMDIAVERLIAAISNHEKILIYGDYDVDGTTSVALVYKYLSNYYKKLDYYIPDRYEEGYGVSIQGIEWAHENEFQLIISLDCGIKGYEPIAHARELGMDFIICDHHTPGESLPNATAILDPKQPDCDYPYKELSGCGVGFKLLQAVTTKMEWDKSLLFEYLDLVAVSIAADIVPITGENRILCYYGLEKLNMTPRVGLQALIQVAGLTPPLNVGNVVFGIAPRINASGRIGHANEAVSLLVSNDPAEADRIASLINTKNQIRRDTQEEITHEALSILADNEVYHDRKSAVLFNPDWHKGVIGIVASKCVDVHYKPTIVLTESNGMVTGSARSVSGFDVHEAITMSSQWLERFGGHKYAAGLSLKRENLDAFVLAFEEAVSSTITPEQERRHITIDAEITLDLITYKFLEVLNQMTPFGPGNMQPTFGARGVQVLKASLLKDLHLKLSVEQNGAVFDAIGFSMPELYDQDLMEREMDIAFNIEENNFRGIRSIQLRLKDIKFTE